MNVFKLYTIQYDRVDLNITLWINNEKLKSKSWFDDEVRAQFWTEKEGIENE